MAFAHLHTHTAYSLLDGEGTIPAILDRAKELGQTAMAITDHGNMYGVIDFYEYAKSIGVKPILGCEVYVAARSRFDKTHEHDSTSSHLILLAENNTGYKNLMKIVSLGYIEGFYYKPRIDMEVLREYSEGIIALSACMFGVLSRSILNNNYEKAKRDALEFIDIFGRENYFIEIQDHGLYDQKRLNAGLINLARELELDVVCTNDIHYVNQSDAEYQDVLMCVQTGKTIDDQDRMKMDTDQMYVKSEDEMTELFSYLPEAVENTQKIADRCNVEIEFGKLHLPEFDVPEGYTAFEYLKELTMNGFSQRYPDNPKDVLERVEYELNTIKSMGYVDYFLIVWDFINYARQNGIAVGPGRGSAAGSVVSYCLRITNVDPIKYDLIFERFLNPERVSMPDIDIDFCYERRQEVIDYVNRKYGDDRVCQIITFGTMAAKQAIRDVGRVLDIPYATVDSVAKEVPKELHITIEKSLKISKKLKAMYDGDPLIKRLIDTASALEGLPRHASTHAAGVVITKEPVYNYVPLQKNEDVITTQFTMTTIERLGLLKMDFLGLRTLTVIRDAVRHIKETHGIDIDIDNIDLDDKDTYDMISSGDTDGVFQLESGGMKSFMTELKPNSLEDIIAGISLYRPGPMDSIPTYVANKNSKGVIKYKHPLLEPILNVTYGCIVYQEQVMQIVRELAGYSLGRADLVRRAMSKKKADVMAQEKKNFIYGIDDGENSVDGAIKRGVDEETANSIFDEMMDFASYAFNKSHAAAYAVVAYQTAWLKRHYPVEFFTALLTSWVETTDKVTKYIEICSRKGIKVLPPDINKSGQYFTVDKDPDTGEENIRFGLAAIKTVGTGVVDEIIKERDLNGTYKSFTEFCTRVKDLKVTKRMVEHMIEGGVFDSLGLKRSVLMFEYEKVMDNIQNKSKSVMPGQINMFGDFEELNSTEDKFQDRPEFPRKELLAMEKKCLGIYVSGHPLDEFADVLESGGFDRIIDINENESGEYSADREVRIAGIITDVRSRITRKNDIMKYVGLEDMTGSISAIVFPKSVLKYDALLKEDSKIIISGNLDVQEDAPPKVRVFEITPLTPENIAANRDRKTNKKVEAQDKSGCRLYVRLMRSDAEAMGNVKKILGSDGGDVSVYIRAEDKKQTYKAPEHMQISLENGGLDKIDKLTEILGADNVKLVNS